MIALECVVGGWKVRSFGFCGSADILVREFLMGSIADRNVRVPFCELSCGDCLADRDVHTPVWELFR